MSSQTKKKLFQGVLRNVFILLLLLALGILHFRQTPTVTQLEPLRVDESFSIAANVTQAKTNRKDAQLQLESFSSGVKFCNYHGGVVGQQCICTDGFAGDHCENVVTGGWLDINRKKYRKYTNSICPKKLSTSGKISDETMRLGAQITKDRFQIQPGASIYDACVGCGGYLQVFNDILSDLKLFGCDVSSDIIAFTSRRFPNDTFFSGACSDPPTLFLADNMFDVVVAGFCINNIIFRSLELVFTGNNNLSQHGMSIVCTGVHDLYRVTKPGGGIYIPQHYESDGVALNPSMGSPLFSKMPLHFMAQCLPHLTLTVEGERPACNVRTRGGIVYAFEKVLYSKANYQDLYYNGGMKTIFVYKPLNAKSAAEPPNYECDRS